MIVEKFPALAKLGKEEKVLLAAELWADAEQVDETPAPNEETLKLLKDRLKQFHSDPTHHQAWRPAR